MILLRHGKRAIAILICISLLISVIPASTSAKDISSTETAVAVGAEVVSMREENVKHYDMGNGTYQAIAYSHPVHEKDSQGNWQDIDFGMTLTQTRGIGTYKTDSGAAFRQNYVAGQPIMTLSDDDTAIAMTLVTNTNTQTMSTQAMQSATPIAVSLAESKADLGTFASAQAANFSNTLFYENVLTGVDLEYIVDPWTVKENIIVKQPAAQYVYNFKLDLDGLYPVLQADGSVLIYNNETNETEYEIPTPYMYDAAGEMSFDVTYTLSGENGVYYFTVTADSSWVNAPERVFPVTIDPSYVISNNVIGDTYINEDGSSEPRGKNKFFYVGENEVAYIKVPIPAIPQGADLNWAAISLYYFYKSGVASGCVGFTAHRVNEFSWEENDLTWDWVIANSGADFGLSSTVLNSDRADEGVEKVWASSTINPSNPRLFSLDITEAAEIWIVNPDANNGIGLKYHDTASTNKSVMFRSTEGPAAYTPKLTYQYYSESEQQYLLKNFYDSTMNGKMDDVSAAISTACTAFRNQFGILLFSDTPSYRGDLTDNNNHKDSYAISEELLNDIEYSNEIIAFWTDHDPGTFCNHGEDPEECIGNTAFAIVHPPRPVLQIMNVPFEDEYEASLSILLMHEIAHTFGLGEKYDGGNHDVEGEWFCVMEAVEKGIPQKLSAFYAYIESGGNAFCENCESELRSAIANGLGE